MKYFYNFLTVFCSFYFWQSNFEICYSLHLVKTLKFCPLFNLQSIPSKWYSMCFGKRKVSGLKWLGVASLQNSMIKWWRWAVYQMVIVGSGCIWCGLGRQRLGTFFLILPVFSCSAGVFMIFYVLVYIYFKNKVSLCN